jgi:hypothetical protein
MAQRGTKTIMPLCGVLSTGEVPETAAETPSPENDRSDITCTVAKCAIPGKYVRTQASPDQIRLSGEALASSCEQRHERGPEAPTRPHLKSFSLACAKLGSFQFTGCSNSDISSLGGIACINVPRSERNALAL